MVPPKRFKNFLPCLGGCSEGLDRSDQTTCCQTTCCRKYMISGIERALFLLRARCTSRHGFTWSPVLPSRWNVSYYFLQLYLFKLRKKSINRLVPRAYIFLYYTVVQYKWKKTTNNIITVSSILFGQSVSYLTHWH